LEGVGLSAQADPSVELRLIAAANQLRTHLLEGDPAGAKALDALLVKLERVGWSSDDVEYLILNIWYGGAIYAAEYEKASKWITKKIGQPFAPAVAFSPEDYAVIIDNQELVSMLLEGLINDRYPFVVSEDLYPLGIFQALDLAPGMRIGEIGSGSGMLSFLAAMMYDSLEVYTNELDWALVDYQLPLVADRAGLLARGSFVEVMEGTKKTTELEGEGLDLIFMQATFHHFTKKKIMLASIRRSLRAGGRLVVVESTLELDGGDHACNKRMATEEIIEQIEAAGFVHEAQRLLPSEDALVLTFRR